MTAAEAWAASLCQTKSAHDAARTPATLEPLTDGAHTFTRAQLDFLVIVVDGARFFAPEDRAELAVSAPGSSIFKVPGTKCITGQCP